MTTTLDRVRKITAREFNVDAASLTADSGDADVSGWDSSTHLVLMMALEDEFGVSFVLDEVTELTSIGSIADAIDARIGQ
ncbi:MAG TPA: acyl carrier protein [Reyranella sp.]|jgi:acyl carrier protein